MRPFLDKPYTFADRQEDKAYVGEDLGPFQRIVDCRRLHGTIERSMQLELLLKEVRQALEVSGGGPDIPRRSDFTGDTDNWFDPRRPLATDIWRVLEGLPPKYYGLTNSDVGKCT
jgi:hypothetical protein